MAKKTVLAEKLDEVKEKIAAACARAKRETKEVTLLAVTKAASPEQIREIVQLGVYDLGESRVQQLVQRSATLSEQMHRRLSMGEAAEAPKPIRWHMIGHVQRNKVKQLAPLAYCIHTVDSLRLAEELDVLGAKLNRQIPVLLQINSSEEEQKYGIAVGAAIHLGEQIATMPNLQFAGLMTMAALDADDKMLRHTFSRTREIFEEMKWQKIGGSYFRHLSMGMSNDYEMAIEEGATIVRVGSAIFGGKSEWHEDKEEEG